MLNFFLFQYIVHTVYISAFDNTSFGLVPRLLKNTTHISKSINKTNWPENLEIYDKFVEKKFENDPTGTKVFRFFFKYPFPNGTPSQHIYYLYSACSNPTFVV